jgi:hypothetical protein
MAAPGTLPVDIGSRLELFVDRVLIDRLDNATLKLHTPQPQPLAHHPVTGFYMTMLMDAGLYKAYYRQYADSYTGEQTDGNAGETTRYAESEDGHEWRFPDLGLRTVDGSTHNNAVLADRAPYCHNFSPCWPAHPEATGAGPHRALAGTYHSGLHAFGSVDGLHWELLQEEPVISCAGIGFDSQNVTFWSQVEQCYVCYLRTWETSHGQLRTISRCTSDDYLHWSDPVAMEPNLPGEHLYVSGTHPYFRAPHIYVALPTRFHPGRGASTDILFMATRAGATAYQRLFTEAFIRPGLDPDRWGNRANYAACGIVPTGDSEISIYHTHSGYRYTLRTDGFASVNAGYQLGELLTQPLIFEGSQLSLNYSTSAAGSLQVEVLDAAGQPIPGFGLADSRTLVGDRIEESVQWESHGDLQQLAGTPVRLRFVLRECDLYAMRFAASAGARTERQSTPTRER